MDKFLKRPESNSNSPNKRQREDPTSPDTWRNPKKFITNSKSRYDNKETPTHNSFTELPVDADIASSDSLKNATKKKVVNNTPVIIIELGTVWNHENIRDVILKYCKEFHMQNRGRKLIRVQCYNAKDHQKLREGLHTENVIFHTFTRKDEKISRAVIKGLPKFVEPNVAEELASLGFAGATASILKTVYPSDCPPILVHLPNGTNMAQFKQIRYLFNCVVDIERYKPTKTTGTQCFRCQSFGHTSRNCNRQPRCVKCALSHPTWECPKKDKSEPACCCNCMEKHPANYSKCPVRLKYIEKTASKRATINKTVVLNTHVAKLHPHKSRNENTEKNKLLVSDALNSRSHTEDIPPDRLQSINPRQKKRLPESVQTSSNFPMDLESTEMLEILHTIQTIKEQFTKCNTFMDKVILVLSHLGHYV